MRLLIHHGGLSTATAGLLAGTPQVLLPRHLEHHVTGYRLFKLGTGVNFTATATLDRGSLRRKSWAASSPTRHPPAVPFPSLAASRRTTHRAPWG